MKTNADELIEIINLDGIYRIIFFEEDSIVFEDFLI